MKFLTRKDVEILEIIRENEFLNKSAISRKSKYISSNLDHTFKKLENEGYIIISKENNKTSVNTTNKGKRVGISWK